MGGIIAPNYPVTSGAALASATSLAGIANGSRLAADTGLAGGGSPQTSAIIPGTVPAPATSRTLTAFAGGGKASALQLSYGVSEVAVVATAADSVLLPYAAPGLVCLVTNNSANSMQVFGRGTDTVNNVATATGVAQAAGLAAMYIGTGGTGDGSDVGTWRRILSA